MSLSREMHLTEAALERIRNTRIDSNEVVDVVMALEEACDVRIEI
jgi:acyl carrier protein